MLFDRPLQMSRLLLTAIGTRLYTYYGDRVPRQGSVLVVSNHRSFLDAPLLMTALNRPIRFACHHYMGQVPVMREVVTQLGGCFPLESAEHRQQSFFRQATELLKTQQVVGLFPEGTPPMIHSPARYEVGEFHRGFAHLALKAPVSDLAILPVAIAAQSETTNSAVPLRLLSFFDPSEPLFDQEGWHPMVMYQHVNLLIGRPLWISPTQREKYQGKHAKAMVRDLSDRCHGEINALLQQGCYS
ncbi:lysophospholipid acyltransferase family protein [Myxacorys almedinensis]|uniref:1-acyl-sn-glycerol-3-phosphate acyltransferase n=1 Tax=Myxacorys almedinensis A TaxID=2690445 RepID=A0A8J8CKA7_9CYAN|nr:lysophospholipid acyltransferase family protein [Myxacorys almedinensis]NDJ18411.1 1-acyl-sn-glycerol-3-phosphate acyltransferase [Myxacorys almedinensis A]